MAKTGMTDLAEEVLADPAAGAAVSTAADLVVAEDSAVAVPADLDSVKLAANDAPTVIGMVTVMSVDHHEKNHKIFPVCVNVLKRLLRKSVVRFCSA